MTAGTTGTRETAAWVTRPLVIDIVSIIATVLGGALAPVNHVGTFRAEMSN